MARKNPVSRTLNYQSELETGVPREKTGTPIKVRKQSATIYQTQISVHPRAHFQIFTDVGKYSKSKNQKSPHESASSARPQQ